MIMCSQCPFCKDVYPPDCVDHHGNHFCICGQGGNIVYTYPRKERKYNNQGWIHFPEDSCYMYKTFEDAFKAMSEPAQRRWKAKHEPQISIFELIQEEKE